MKSHITLTGRQVGRIVGESPGNISIKGRIQRWPGTSGHPWAIPAEFVSKQFGIPVSEIREKLTEDDRSMKAARLSRKMARIASKSKGSK